MKNNIIKKLISIILAIASVASMSLLLPASANYTNFLNLTSKYERFLNAVNLNTVKQFDLKNMLSSFEQDPEFQEIKNSGDFSKKFTQYMKSQQIINKKDITEYVNQVIVPAFSKNKKNKGENIVFDKNVLMKYLKDLITVKANLATSICISKDEYNKVMDDQFSKAIEKLKETNPSFDENQGDTLNVGNISVQSPNGNTINFNQISISTENMRHIVVGSIVKKQFQNKPLKIGHTKYAKNGMEILAYKRDEHLRGAMNLSDSLINLFKCAVGFNPIDYIKSKTKINDNGFYNLEYYPLNDSDQTIKGMFPENWEWQDIRSAIINVISNNNCIYTSIELGKDMAYFYDLSGNTPILVVIDATDKRVVTAFPMSLEDFKRHITNNYDGLVSNNPLRPLSKVRINEENYSKFIDEKKKKQIESKSNINIQKDKGFLTIA